MSNRMVTDANGDEFFMIPEWAFKELQILEEASDKRHSIVEMSADAFEINERFHQNDSHRVKTVRFKVWCPSKSSRGLVSARIYKSKIFNNDNKVIEMTGDDNVGYNMKAKEFKSFLAKAEDKDFIDFKEHYDFDVPAGSYRGDMDYNGVVYFCFELPKGNPYDTSHVLVPRAGYEVKSPSGPDRITFSTREGTVLLANGGFPDEVDTSTEVPNLNIYAITMAEFKQDADQHVLESGKVSFEVPASAVVEMEKDTMVRFPVGSKYEGMVCYIPNNGDVSVRPEPVNGIENSEGRYVITCKSDASFDMESAEGNGGYGKIYGGMLRKVLFGAKPEDFYANKKAAKKAAKWHR